MLPTVVAYRRAIEDSVSPGVMTWMTVVMPWEPDGEGVGAGASDGSSEPIGAVGEEGLGDGSTDPPGLGTEGEGALVGTAAEGLASDPGAHAASARTNPTRTAS